MFEKNTLTFNPSWDRKSAPLERFTDIRELQRELKASGVEPQIAADETSDGPAHFILMDPHGNPILIDHHV